MKVTIDLIELLEEIRMIIKEELKIFNSLHNEEIERPVSQKEIAKYLGVSPQTIIRYRKKKKIPFFLAGSKPMFDKKKVIAAIEKNKK